MATTCHFWKNIGSSCLLMLCIAQQHHLMALALNVIQPATPYYGDFTKKMTVRTFKLLLSLRICEEYPKCRAPASSHHLLSGLLPVGDHGWPRGELPWLHHHRRGAQLLQQPSAPPSCPSARPCPPAQEFCCSRHPRQQPSIIWVVSPAEHASAGSDWLAQTWKYLELYCWQDFRNDIYFYCLIKKVVY